jgi:hypothetical protein
MITVFTLDTVTLILVVCFFVPFFTWRGQQAYVQGRLGKFWFCITLELYVLRLAYLRVSTVGGKITIYDPNVFSFSKELGDPVVFFVLTLALLLTAVYRMGSDDAYIKKHYVKREEYDELNRRYGLLLRDRTKNEP